MAKIKKENLINEKRPHESGIKHVSGRAFYIDDISEPPGTLFGAIGWSKKAHAIIKKMNLDEVIKSDGVIAVVTSKDIEGRNDVGPVYDGDPTSFLPTISSAVTTAITPSLLITLSKFIFLIVAWAFLLQPMAPYKVPGGSGISSV